MDPKTDSVNFTWLGIAIAVAVTLLASPAQAAFIAYSAVDLPDDGSVDLWRYDYTVTGYAFAAGEGFDVNFVPDLYSDPAVAATPAAWSTGLILADPSEPVSGFAFAALADNGDTSLLQSFSVRFAWFGAGAPGTQAFDLFDADFNVVASGVTVTTTAVPEPAAVAMLFAGIALLGLRGKRRPRGEIS